MVIDMTCGRKPKSVIILGTVQIVLAALLPETVASRLRNVIHQGEAVRDHVE